MCPSEKDRERERERERKKREKRERGERAREREKEREKKIELADHELITQARNLILARAPWQVSGDSPRSKPGLCPVYRGGR